MYSNSLNIFLTFAWYKVTLMHTSDIYTDIELAILSNIDVILINSIIAFSLPGF